MEHVLFERVGFCFPNLARVSYLARFQLKPSGAAEACLRAPLRWLLTRLHRVQIMPSPEGAKRCWFLRPVLECGIRVRGSLDVPRLLHQGVF